MCLGLPARVIAIDGGRPGVAWVDVGTVPREIDLGLLADDPPGVGDWVVIHLGYALERLTEAEALETIGLLHDPTTYELPSPSTAPAAPVLR